MKLINQHTEENILVPLDFYTSKVVDNIDTIINNSNFRSKYMKKIDINIKIIHKMIYEEDKDIDFVSKWLRIPIKKFISYMNRYNRWINNKSNDTNEKIKTKIERIQDIKGLIKIYLGLNRGKWVNIKRILDFIIPWNL